MSTLPSAPPSLAADDPRLHDLQCNILSPLRRNRSVHLLVELPANQAAARAYVQSWAAAVTTMDAQIAADQARWALPPAGRPPRGLVRSFMVSALGMIKLGCKLGPGGVSSDEAFPLGMRAREHLLFQSSARPKQTDYHATWQAPFDDPAAHGWIEAHLLLAADGPEVPGRACPAMPPALLAAEAAAITSLAIAGGRVVHRFDGYLAANGRGETIEHFGFPDEVSNPLFLASDWQWAASHQPAPYFGHTLENVLFPLRHAPGYGTHCVFRQIEQDVAAFAALATADAEAMIGRRRDGSSLVNPPGSGPGTNLFDYSGDPAGARCPFHAHVRKSNPRGSSDKPGTEPSHLFPRRGMLYGDRPHHPASGFVGLPTQPVGLLFMGYMADIRVQFEHLQKAWFANADFPQKSAGYDALVGLDDPHHLPAYTAVRGGEHFFVPPISWLANPV